jgi:NAD(P) transhydrogenase subunit alpha
MASAASAAYARNVSTLLLYMISDGNLAVDLTDELQAGVVITHDGHIVHPALAKSAGGNANVHGASD